MATKPASAARKRVGTPIAPAPTPEDRRAAARNLGAIYRHFLRYNRQYLPFGSWVIAKDGPLPQPHPGLLAALVDDSVYKSDATRQQQSWKTGLPYRPPYARYRADYGAIMPDVFAEASKFAHSSLTREDLVLGNFKFRIVNEPGLADRVSAAAAAVLKGAGGLEKREDLLAATIARAKSRGYVPADFEKTAT